MDKQNARLLTMHGVRTQDLCFPEEKELGAWPLSSSATDKCPTSDKLHINAHK